MSSARAADRISQAPSAPRTASKFPPASAASSATNAKAPDESSTSKVATLAQRQSGPGGRVVSVRPTSAGRSTIRCNAYEAPSADRQTAAAPGQGSAATARYWRPGGSPRATARSSTIASGLPTTAGGRFNGRAVAPPGVSNTAGDRKSTRLNSSHANISYAVFCLKKNNKFNVILSTMSKNNKKMFKLQNSPVE